MTLDWLQRNKLAMWKAWEVWNGQDVTVLMKIYGKVKQGEL